MSTAHVRLVDEPASRLDPYAPLTNQEWIHERRYSSEALHRAQVKHRALQAKYCVFEPKVLQEIAQSGQEAFERGGRDYDVLFDTVHRELLRRYPGKIAKEVVFTVNMAGGARGRYALMAGSLHEYVLLFNTPLRANGFSGRYLIDIWDFVMAGSLNYFDDDHHTAVRKPAGELTYLPRHSATVYDSEEGTVAMEYGRGFVPQALDFGILRTALLETGDPVHAYRQLKRYTQLMFGFGR